MSALTDEDRDDLDVAITLIKRVVARHPCEVTGPLLTAVSVAVHDVKVIELYLGAIGERT